MSKTLSKNFDKLPNFLNFFDLFCFKELLTNKKKRNFLKLANEIINKKLSIEYILKSYSNFEKLKMIVLNKEQINNFNSIPNFKIEKHLTELVNLNKNNLENMLGIKT